MHSGCSSARFAYLVSASSSVTRITAIRYVFPDRCALFGLGIWRQRAVAPSEHLIAPTGEGLFTQCGRGDGGVVCKESVFESTRFKRYGYSRFKTSVNPMSLFKKLLVILPALIAAGC